jgi:tetratricopeptide (TPR) repeat protein
MHGVVGAGTIAWTLDEPPEPANGYCVRHGVAHLLHAGRVADAAARLSDLAFAGAWIRWCRQRAHDDFTPVMRAWHAIGIDRAGASFAAQVTRAETLERGDLANARLVIEFLQDAGFRAEAQALGPPLIARHRAVFGDEHPETASAERMVGLVYKAAKRYAEAGPMLEHALAVHLASLEDGDPERFATMNGCASMRAALGRYDASIALFEETLAGRRHFLGPTHPRTLVTMASLALTLTSAGRHAEAVPLHRETLEARAAQLGPDHPKTLKSVANLGRALFLAGQPGEAVSLLAEAVSRRDRVLGPGHPHTKEARKLLDEARAAAG